jgi:hypothetical protein
MGCKVAYTEEIYRGQRFIAGIFLKGLRKITIFKIMIEDERTYIGT